MMRRKSQINRVIYRLWHNKSVIGKIGYIGKDNYYPNRVSLTKRSKERSSPKLYKALKKYPKNLWNVEILASGFKSNAALSRAEIRFIKKFDSKNKGYNCTDGGEGACGRPVSKKTRYKLSKSNTGRRYGKECRDKIRASKLGQIPWNKGRRMNKQFRDKCRIRQLGKLWTTDSRTKVSKSMKKVWIDRKANE
jgi:hypothetical protein